MSLADSGLALLSKPSFFRSYAVRYAKLVALSYAALALVATIFSSYVGADHPADVSRTLFTIFFIAFVVLDVFSRLVSEPGTKALNELRGQRHGMIIDRVIVSVSLHLSPRDMRHQRLSERVLLYRPSDVVDRFLTRSQADPKSWFKYYSVPEDNALWIEFVPELDNGKCKASKAFTVSVWQVGNEVRIGIFLYSSFLHQFEEESRRMIESAVESLFLDGPPAVSNRHSYVLYERSLTSVDLLFDVYFWDRLAAQAAHLTIHSALAAIELIQSGAIRSEIDTVRIQQASE